MTNDFQKELDVAVQIAKQAGEIMLQYFDNDQNVKRKLDDTLVTVADTTINSLVIELLTKEFPDDGVIGEEESNTEYGLGRKWFCDPIDGTNAFVWGIPTAMFSLGLVVDGQPQVGVAYDPFLDKMYTSIKGHGSYCNGKILAVSTDALRDGFVAITGNIKRIYGGLQSVKNLMSENIKPVAFSGAVYKSVLIARGRLVGYLEELVNAHDMAAVQLIVEEAGGKITGIDGGKLDYSKPFRGAVVSNGLVHDELVEIINRI